jgi:hypothetical protein
MSLSGASDSGRAEEAEHNALTFRQRLVRLPSKLYEASVKSFGTLRGGRLMTEFVPGRSGMWRDRDRAARPRLVLNARPSGRAVLGRERISTAAILTADMSPWPISKLAKLLATPSGGRTDPSEPWRRARRESLHLDVKLCA